MLTHGYSYDTCLRGSVTKAWTVDDCFRGRDFDFNKPFLPERIAGVDAIGCLSDDEKRMLDIEALQKATGHTFTDVEQDEIRTHQRRTYRWTFLVSGLQHPTSSASWSRSPTPAPTRSRPPRRRCRPSAQNPHADRLPPAQPPAPSRPAETPLFDAALVST